MTNAYDSRYLNDAMRNLGEAFDYAVNSCSIEIDIFSSLLIISGVAKQFSDGNPAYIAGRSGTELVMDVMRAVGKNIEFPPANDSIVPSPEYWCGHVLCYYMWKTNTDLEHITNAIPVSEIMKMYPTMHEASEDRFVFALSDALQSEQTPLQRMRKLRGLSQSELARLSGVNLRTLQQYEIRAKDIKKANVGTVIALAHALRCEVEDIV